MLDFSSHAPAHPLATIYITLRRRRPLLLPETPNDSVEKPYEPFLSSLRSHHIRSCPTPRPSTFASSRGGVIHRRLDIAYHKTIRITSSLAMNRLFIVAGLFPLFAAATKTINVFNQCSSKVSIFINQVRIGVNINSRGTPGVIKSDDYNSLRLSGRANNGTTVGFNLVVCSFGLSLK